MKEEYGSGRYAVEWIMRQTVEIPEGEKWNWSKVLDDADNAGAELVDWEINELNKL